MLKTNEKGALHLLILIASLWIIGFLVVFSTFGFKDELFKVFRSTTSLASQASAFAIDTNGTLGQNLVAYYRFSEASGSAVIDNAGDNDGTVVGAVDISEGQVGGGRYFHGLNNSYVDIGDNPLFENNVFSVSAWVKKDAGDCGGFSNCSIISKGQSGNTGFSLRLSKVNGVYRPELSIRDSLQIVYGSTIIQPGVWYHIAGIVDGTTVKLYVNGILEGSVPQTQIPNFGGERVKIGNANSNSDLPMGGFLDEVGYWKKALVAQEVSDLYNNGNGNYCSDPCKSPDPTSSPTPPVTIVPTGPDYNNNPVTKKVLAVIYDPVLSGGQKLHQARGWGDPAILLSSVISDIETASGNYIDYQIVETAERNEFPIKRDGFRYTETSYNSCMSNTSTCHSPDDVDYNQMWVDLNICSKVSTGVVDEVMVYGFPYSGFDEYALKIPGDNLPYPTSNYWFYQGRKKNIPDCNGKTVWVMGYNFERGVAEAIHSYGHRAENALGLTVARGNWQSCNGNTVFDAFTCINKDINPSTPVQQSGCGNIHYPPNGLSDYDYGNGGVVQSACANFANYPSTATSSTSISCSNWTCTGDSQREFIKWWLAALPRLEYKTSDNNLRNWWKYIVDFDKALLESQFTGSSATPTPSSSPTPSPSPSATPGPLIISNITVANITVNSATINWTTSAPSTSRVSFGTSSNKINQNTAENTNLVTTHSVTLTGLRKNTTYYFRARSKNSLGQETLSSTQSFKTSNSTQTTTKPR